MELRRPKRKRTVAEKSWRFLVFLSRFVLVALIMLAWFQRSLIYHPTKSGRLSAKDSELVQAVTDVQVVTHDKLPLNGWLAMAGARKSADEPDVPKLLSQERPLIIVFPGNGGHRVMRQSLLHALGALGADAMIFDHRGFGDNGGSPTETHLVRDAHTVWKFAIDDLKVPARRIVLYGESLGGGVATRLAGDLCAEGIEPGGLIIQASFSSLVDAGRHHFPMLPVSLLLIDRFESEKHIQRATCPYLHLHGAHDVVVPLKLGQKLFRAAPEKSLSGIPKQFVQLPNANHNDVYGPDVKLVASAVQSFLTGVKQRATAVPPK